MLERLDRSAHGARATACEQAVATRRGDRPAGRPTPPLSWRREDDFWRVEFSSDAHEIFERLGEMPLPPYVERAAEAADRERYQTVYAREPGAVAAPTAGLHFDDELLQACRAAGVEFAYVTLHVGAGTFQPVRVDDIAQHRMHAELCVVPQATCDAVAACASAWRPRHRCGHHRGAGAGERGCRHGLARPYAGETRLFITPGKRFNVIDAHGHQLPPAGIHAAHAGERLRRARARARAPIVTRWRSATGSSATVMPCSSSRRPDALARGGPQVKFELLGTEGAGAPRSSAPQPRQSSRRRCSCRSAPTARSRR